MHPLPTSAVLHYKAHPPPLSWRSRADALLAEINEALAALPPTPTTVVDERATLETQVEAWARAGARKRLERQKAEIEAWMAVERRVRV